MSSLIRPENKHIEQGKQEDESQLGLVRQCDIKGVLHSHSHYADGFHALEEMVEIAREIGLEYLGISDHYLGPGHAEGLDENAVAAQRDEIQRLREEFAGFDLLQGVEVDLDRDGKLPVADRLLSQFDYVIVSLSEQQELTPEQQTQLLIKAARNPLTTILSKPLGDYMLWKSPCPIDVEAVLVAAAESRTAVEIDANPHSLELDWENCRRAQELGIMMSINPNAHRAARLVDYRHGVELARKAGICCRSILNTMSYAELRDYLKSRS